MSSPPFQLPGSGEVEWLVVDLKDHKETEIFSLFPICNAFMLHSKKPEVSRLSAEQVLLCKVHG